MAAEHDREQAAKACQRADELFLAGNICGAHRQVSKAKRLCPSLPGVANALAAYEVLVAGAGASNNWRAILSIRPCAAATDDAVKKRFRRLSLLVHPDKNSCAAAEEAFKLLRQAFDDALAARPEDRGPCAAAHDDEAPPAAARDEPRPRRSRTARRDKPRRTARRDKLRRTAAHEKPHRRAAAPPWRNPPPQSQKVRRITIYCPFCEKDFIGYVGHMEEKFGMRCARCPERLHAPWQTKPPVEKELFACPARCPKCDAQYPSKVCVGTWLLGCKACSTPTMFDVRGADMATARCPTTTRRGST